jgi:hypothetical protein
VRETPHGDAKGTRETKISQFELAFTVDEQILGFKVTAKTYASYEFQNKTKSLGTRR